MHEQHRSRLGSYDGETICLTDGLIAGTISGASVPEIQLLVQGSSQFNMPDNIAFQPGRGNWIIEEDGSTGDNVNGAAQQHIWSCLDDGRTTTRCRTAAFASRP